MPKNTGQPVMTPDASAAIMPSTHPGFLATMARTERWLVPSVLLTIVPAFLALSTLRDYSGVLTGLLIIPGWLIIALIVGAVYFTVKCAKQGGEGPVSTLAKDWRGAAHAALPTAVVITLSAISMFALMWIKSQLNFAVPFWADPLLADIDKAMFFGTDPWVLLQSLNTTALGKVYHGVWPVFLILGLITASVQPSSQKKAAIITTYFALWTIVGPLIHVLLPAGGPVFYESLGYGGRFAQLTANDETRGVLNYLWNQYSSTSFGPGSGISAMPSMHVATTMWAVMSIHAFARRWHLWSSGFGVLILVLSVALGWHYLVDGIVGALATVATYWCATRWFTRSA